MLPLAGLQENWINQNHSDQNVCRLPSLLAGARCYTDASTTPDDPTSSTRKAGLGIFILDPTSQIKLFIKAQISQVNCVLMAEAAGIALAASITSMLHIRNISFLTDNQLLASFFNGPDLCSPPRWDIKPFTQRFLNAVANSSYRVLKIHRSSNNTAHLLASQSYRAPELQCNLANFTCSNVTHEGSCPLREALRHVSWEPFSLIAASCC